MATNNYKLLGRPNSPGRNSAFRYLFRGIRLCFCLLLPGVAIVDRYQHISHYFKIR